MTQEEMQRSIAQLEASLAELKGKGKVFGKGAGSGAGPGKGSSSKSSFQLGLRAERDGSRRRASCGRAVRKDNQTYVLVFSVMFFGSHTAISY